jgi:hypothetical protein
LRHGTSHLAGIARQGDGEGVLALGQTQRSALLAPALEIAAKRAVESRRIETGEPATSNPARANAPRLVNLTPEMKRTWQDFGDGRNDAHQVA